MENLVSNNNKPLSNGNQQQGTITVSASQMQAAAALQQASMNQLYQSAAQQHMHSGLQQMQKQFNAQYNQMQQSMNQMMAQQNIRAGSITNFWDPVSKYSVAELKLAIGKKIKIAGHNMKLISVDEDKITVNEGVFFITSVRDYRHCAVDETPLIDNMYTTKLGRLCKE